MPSDNAARRNPWIMLAGAAVLIALAIGLLNGGADAASVSSSGYGGTPTEPGPQQCFVRVGYSSRPCDGKVSDLSNKPRKPVRGKGFVVKFKSQSGGTYRVFAKKRRKVYELAKGVSGVATVETRRVGKKLRAGKYSLNVTVTNNKKADTASKGLTIRKP